MKNQGKLMLYSVILGLIFSILFYKQNIGISFPIFALFVFVFLIYITKSAGFSILSNAWLYAIPIILLSLRFFLSKNSYFEFFNIAAIVFLFSTLTLSFLKRRLTDFTLLSFISSIFYVIFSPINYFHIPFQWLNAKFKIKNRNNNYTTLKKILIGLVVSLPFLLVILVLLSSADAVFNNTIPFFASSIDNFLYNINFEDFLAIVIITVAVATYSHCFGISLSSEIFINGNEATTEKAASKLKCFDNTILITILVSFNNVF